MGFVVRKNGIERSEIPNREFIAEVFEEAIVRADITTDILSLYNGGIDALDENLTRFDEV